MCFPVLVFAIDVLVLSFSRHPWAIVDAPIFTETHVACFPPTLDRVSCAVGALKLCSGNQPVRCIYIFNNRSAV